ncbi:MAG: 30S ribosomal protein THX [Ignavibacteriales bacterium]|nr:30S ribosomal protein THX [Ignavibacteriales bacterium]
MGKGDKKSKKGKRFQHSFGKTRARKKGLTISSRKKVEVENKT